MIYDTDGDDDESQQIKVHSIVGMNFCMKYRNKQKGRQTYRQRMN